MENTNYSIGSIIKEIRMEKLLTQKYVAGDFFSTRHLINIENGSVSPSTDILLHICQALGVSIEELFNRLYAKEQTALDEIKNRFNFLYENGSFDQIHEELSIKLDQIVNKNICAAVTYKFLKIMTDYYGNSDEKQILYRLESLIESNPIILEEPLNDLHVNIIIQYIQVSSYSEKSLVVAQSIDFIKDSALTYAVNMGLLVKEEWKNVVDNCRLCLENVRNKDLFILPGIYFQLGVSLYKMNDLTGLNMINKAFIHAQLNCQSYYLDGFNELLEYFSIVLPIDCLMENKDWLSE
ncbi:hypothetical protein BAU15_00575 [Enterococcus sp. JM4C]|uniref:helix-turn-helix domain-containing protein n=1 Tax=Candidatus Enterococcus huntleyi TaxID=1857217 RepID=UPI00137B49A6|nr:helix-turn-helix transcriptional regulator [Enterococcus sp. JM4C]KAF1299174.1 hypothetical protein BAU15_00575 [Enterococcus sp. JM4C]